MANSLREPPDDQRAIRVARRGFAGDDRDGWDWRQLGELFWFRRISLWFFRIGIRFLHISVFTLHGVITNDHGGGVIHLSILHLHRRILHLRILRRSHNRLGKFSSTRQVLRHHRFPIRQDRQARRRDVGQPGFLAFRRLPHGKRDQRGLQHLRGHRLFLQRFSHLLYSPRGAVVLRFLLGHFLPNRRRGDFQIVQLFVETLQF
mmetsp:Transcript_13041/g.48794  ORF Transcript_13041/g.48794 Transcript_13041/m.48794 type:complete len:204 (-) Transcript_13041:580-1191(-)